MRGYTYQTEFMLGFNEHFWKNVNWDRKNADIGKNHDVIGIVFTKPKNLIVVLKLLCSSKQLLVLKHIYYTKNN